MPVSRSCAVCSRCGSLGMGRVCGLLRGGGRYLHSHTRLHNFEVWVNLDDKLLLLQIAFSLVTDSSDYTTMSIDNRIDEVRRVFKQLEMLVEGKSEERDSLVN